MRKNKSVKDFIFIFDSKFGEDSALFYLLKIFTGLGSFCFIFFAYNFTSEADYGQFSLLHSELLVFTALFGGLSEQIILKYGKYYSSIIKFLLISLALSVIAYVYFNKTRGSETIILYYGVLIFIIFSNINQSYYRKTGDNHLLVVTEITRIGIMLASLILLPYLLSNLDASWTILVFSFGLGYLSSCIFFLIKNREILRFKHLKHWNHKDIESLKYGFSISLWLFLANLLNLSDRWLIFQFLGDSELGQYSFVYDISYKIMAFVISPILVAAHPKLLNDKKEVSSETNNKISQLRKKIINILPILLLVSIIILIILSIQMDKPFLFLIFLGTPILLGCFIWQISMLEHKKLEQEGEIGKMLLFILLSLVMNLTINIGTWKLMGIYTFAISSLLSYSFYFFLVYTNRKV